jgi:hypothetical protein
MCFLFYNFFTYLLYLNIFIQVNWYEIIFALIHFLDNFLFLTNYINFLFNLRNSGLDLT